VTELGQAFAVGLFVAATPCLLPLYPAFIAYLATNGEALAGRRSAGLLGLVILAGVLSAMIAAGIVITIVALPLGPVLTLLVPIADGVVVALGVGLLLGWNAFARVPGLRVPVTGNPFRQAYLYGVLLGPLALPCSGAFLVALLAISTDIVDAGLRLLTFLAFGLGFGLPLVGLSIASAAGRQALVRSIVSHQVAIDRVAGLVLIVVGAAGLVSAWPGERLGGS
jgi:cytochrome c-type biogenesis protein